MFRAFNRVVDFVLGPERQVDVIAATLPPNTNIAIQEMVATKRLYELFDAVGQQPAINVKFPNRETRQGLQVVGQFLVRDRGLKVLQDSGLPLVHVG